MIRAAVAARDLASVAGPVEAFITTPGTLVRGRLIDPMTPRIGYGVGAALAEGGWDRPIASLGATNLTANGVGGGMVLRTSQTQGMVNRSQTQDGGIVFRNDDNPGWVPGRICVWAFWWDGVGSGIQRYGGPAIVTSHNPAGNGMVGEVRTGLSAPEVSTVPVAVASYLGLHSAAQRLAIMRWMGARFGVTPS